VLDEPRLARGEATTHIEAVRRYKERLFSGINRGVMHTGPGPEDGYGAAVAGRRFAIATQFRRAKGWLERTPPPLRAPRARVTAAAPYGHGRQPEIRSRGRRANSRSRGPAIRRRQRPVRVAKRTL